MKINTLLCQEEFIKLYLSNITFYLITNVTLNELYITKFIVSKIKANYFSADSFYKMKILVMI